MSAAALAAKVLDVLDAYPDGLCRDQIRLLLRYRGVYAPHAALDAALAALDASDEAWSVGHRVRTTGGGRWEPVFFIPSPAELARHRAASAAATVPGPDRRAGGEAPGAPGSDRGARPV